MKVITITDGLRACAYIEGMPEEFSADEVKVLIEGAFANRKIPEYISDGDPNTAVEICPNCGLPLKGYESVCMMCGQRIHRFKL